MEAMVGNGGKYSLDLIGAMLNSISRKKGNFHLYFTFFL